MTCCRWTRGRRRLTETALRLLFIDAGLPRPTTQIPIYDHDGNYLRTVDMGWEEVIRQAWDAMVSRGWRP
jgi:hypothetical protein